MRPGVSTPEPSKSERADIVSMEVEAGRNPMAGTRVQSPIIGAGAGGGQVRVELVDGCGQFTL